MATEPLVKFAEAGTAPILSYNVPEPVSYFGSCIVEMDLPASMFRTLETTQPDLLPENITVERVRQAMLGGFLDREIFPIDVTHLRYFETVPGKVIIEAKISQEFASKKDHLMVSSFDGFNEFVDPQGVRHIVFDQVLTSTYTMQFLLLTPQQVHENYLKGLRLETFRTPDQLDDLDVRFVGIVPRMALIEVYRLSSFLGDYGAGRVVNTFSLLPGEKTRIAVKTFNKTTTTRNEASSVLDSHSQEAADSLDQAIRSERSNKEEEKRQDEWRVETSASANMGYVSAKLSAGYAGSASAGREQFAKNVSNSVNRTSQRASNKRDIQIDQRSQSQAEISLEENTTREIQNINTSRTLNFVFRQMNQEFITVLHLVEARVAFMYGDLVESTRVVDLPSLDDLLNSVVKDGSDPNNKEEHRNEVRKHIRSILENIFDHRDQQQALIEEVPLGAGNRTFLRVRRDLVNKATDRITVPGIILSVQRNVMRTDGLIVEALLGQGNGLDEYSKGLQDEQVRNKKLQNSMQQALIDREKLAQRIFTAQDAASADLFFQAYFDSSLGERKT